MVKVLLLLLLLILLLQMFEMSWVFLRHTRRDYICLGRSQWDMRFFFSV